MKIVCHPNKKHHASGLCRQCYKRLWRQNNPRKVKAAAKYRYQNNKEKIKAQNKANRLKNVIESKLRDKIYKQKTKAMRSEWSRKYRTIRYHSDLKFKLKSNLRCRVWAALQLKGATKSQKTLDLLGCSIEFLKKYLENQFKNGIGWNNYGEWHVDHRIPCDRFDLTKPEEQRKCFHYTNLQPLWATDNLKKGAK